MSSNPSTNGAPRVAILKATYRTAEEQIREALRLLDYQPQRSKILLKPNLPMSPHWLPLGGVSRAALTNTRLIEALLRIFDGSEVVIAEGSFASYDTDKAFENSGVAALARKYGAQIVNLDRAERVDVPWAFGTLRLPALLETHEYINLPKLKTHVQTGMTLGCKNQKGLLRSADKIRFHQDHDLDEAIRALADAVQPALTIVDGIVGLDGGGPTIGRSRRVGVAVAGRDMKAVDVACCDLVSVPLEHVPHLEGVPYHTVGRAVDSVRVQFKTTREVVIANAHFHGTIQTCSRCLQSAHSGLAVFWRSPYHLLRGMWSVVLNRTDVLVGKGHDTLPAKHGRLLCYGDCTRELAEKHGLPWVPGCPPSAQAHLSVY
jgi:uncharacterized protein (DUF362 family)